MSRLRNLFFGKSNGNSNIRGQSYDAAVARDPPVKGSYPVAGNGPNVLEEIQRSRAKRDTRRQSAVAAAPNVPRYREDPIERPRTAPNDGHRRGLGSVNSNGSANVNGNSNGRTRSGFSMKSPPSFFSSSSRRNSLRNSTVEPPPTPPVPNPSVRSTTPKPPREVQTYQPRKGVEAEQYNDAFVPPFARHNRSDSHASHKSHVDLLEAHSNIRPSRETSQHRTKASGVRNYGEDVADRNIAGSKSKEREPRLVLNSPEFSYLRTVYSPKKRSGLGGSDGSHSRTSSALGHVLGHDDVGPSDDIQPHTRPLRHAKAASVRSTATATASRPGVPYPLRTDSPSVYSYSTNGGRDDDRSTNGDLAHNRSGRALSPLSASSIQDSSMHETLRRPGATPDRGRRTLREPPPVVPSPKQSGLSKVFKPSAAAPRIASVPENVQPAAVPSRTLKEPPPVATPEELPRATQPTHLRQKSNSSAKQRRRTMSSASQTTTTTNGHASKGSYSAFPSSSDRSSTRSPTSATNKRAGMLIEERSEPISLEGVVDLSNTVDTDVTTKTLPGTYPPPIPTISIHRPRPNISRPLSTSRMSVRSGHSSQYTAPVLSPLHVSPHDIMQPPSFPPENWPLIPDSETGNSAANMRQ
ncbi:uncharacterized protein LY89DRAFT_412204 [Mollisia scopiformis]|uniref:Uncharacterized protein n=1 Tax=Mollisia scopiformis TaxID=149040 RepID=A0A132B2E0_MOLSC|nr:uncharacterized protein LY89DRAFT_412204 [Mollisia scopiformis]KUJ06413.1 hypothetical protein LY89DRAFT_412204 [Mollisia scopiformis]